MFEGYRSLGYYASEIPFSVVKSDQDILIASSIGEHAFYVYDSKHLGLTYASRYIHDEITQIEASEDGFIYTALYNKNTRKSQIVCWKKMNKVLEFNGHDSKILSFIIAGPFVFTLGDQGDFISFDRKTGKVNKQMKFEEEF